MSEHARPLWLVPDADASPTKLSFQGVSKAFTTGSGAVVEALRDVSFEVGAGWRALGGRVRF